MREARRWINKASKRSLFDSILDKVVRDLFRGGERPQRQGTGAARSPAKPRRPSFALEIMEPRVLLSADPGLLVGSVLTGNLTEQADTTVVALNRVVTPDGVAKDGGLIVDLTVNGVLQQYGDVDHGVTSIVLQGLGGDDDFKLVDALPIDVTIDGGAGNNTIHGPALGTEWTIDGANSGSANGITSFTNIQNLVGGS
ncbi:MAG: large repetitive protein, partial [Bradyrhizobium sp.]|nr:large repetitive protein [Bradyrhizobium sp.]